MLVLFFDPHRELTILRPDGSVHIDSIGRIASFEPYLWLRARVAGDVRDTALRGGGIGAGLAVAALFGLHLLGRRLGRGRRLRGGELVSHGKARPPYVAMVAVVVAAEPGSRSPPLPHCRYPLAEGCRDQAHDRLRHHGIGKDRAHRRSRRADQGEG